VASLRVDLIASVTGAQTVQTARRGPAHGGEASLDAERHERAHDQRRQCGGAVVGLAPSLGKRDGHDDGNRQRARGERKALAPPQTRDRADRDHREKEAGHRAGRRGQRAEDAAGSRAFQRPGGERGDAEGDTEREAETTDVEVAGGRDGEPQRGRAGVSLGLPVREHGEQGDGAEHRKRSHEPRSQQRAQRGREKAVAGKVMAAEPRVVPQRQAVARKSCERYTAAARSAVRGFVSSHAATSAIAARSGRTWGRRPSNAGNVASPA
jgi:hypothetical protein